MRLLICLALLCSFMTAMTACVQPRVKRYQTMLDPLLGTGKKKDVTRLLGAPATCKTTESFEKCEYRTAAGRNDPVPRIFKRDESLGPDVSPYEYFDVLEVQFDALGVFKDWQPIYLR